MLLNLIHKLYNWTLRWAQHPQSTKALSLLSFLEAFVFPLPVDPLLLAMSFSKPKRSLYYAFLSTLFSTLGALVGYFIGFYTWTTLSPWFFTSVFSQESFNYVSSSLKDTSFIAIFIAGFSPVPFKIFTIAAGVVVIPLLPFIGAVIFARGLRYFILGGLIFKTGQRAQVWIENHFEKATYIILAFIVLSLVLFKLSY